MPAAVVSTTVTELPESRVRVEAQIPADELERRIDQVARSLGRDMKMPGFRAGKIPSKVVVQRLGREVVLDEAIRATLGRWYVQAVEETGIHTVGDPDLSLGDQGGPGEPWSFSFEVGVRPVATLGTYKGLEAPRREPAADEEIVSGQLDELRERMSRLETVEEPAGRGRLRRHGLRRHARRRGGAVRGRGRVRPADRARLGAPDPGLRGGSHRRERGR